MTDINGVEIKVGDIVTDGGKDRPDIRRKFLAEVLFIHEATALVKAHNEWTHDLYERPFILDIRDPMVCKV